MDWIEGKLLSFAWPRQLLLRFQCLCSPADGIESMPASLADEARTPTIHFVLHDHQIDSTKQPTELYSFNFMALTAQLMSKGNNGK